MFSSNITEKNIIPPKKKTLNKYLLKILYECALFDFGHRNVFKYAVLFLITKTKIFNQSFSNRKNTYHR